MHNWRTLIFIGLVVTGVCGLIWWIGINWGLKTPVVSPPQTVAPIPQSTDPVSITELYRLINAWRTENKLSPLKVDSRLEQSAKAKLELILSQARFNHLDQNKQPNWSLLTQANYDYSLAGENLAFSGQSAWQIFSAWQKSASHSAQLLESSYLDMGAAQFCPSTPNQTTTSVGCTVVLHLARAK